MVVPLFYGDLSATSLDEDGEIKSENLLGLVTEYLLDEGYDPVPVDCEDKGLLGPQDDYRIVCGVSETGEYSTFTFREL